MNINQYNISDETIFHIVNKEDLEAILEKEYYVPQTLEEEGFIHLSKRGQVSWVIETFYSSQKEICVLGIDTNKLVESLRYEGAAINDGTVTSLPQDAEFPHLYGPLNTNAIVNIIEASAFFDIEMDDEIEMMIGHYGFERLPVEGTFYKSTYASIKGLENGRVEGTAMIGMYSNEPLSLSCFHRLKSDEVWHFYGGDPFRLVLLYPNGETKEIIMGSDPSKGQLVQYVIPANTWQAGELFNSGKYALFGCTMAPGFHPEDFEAATIEELRENYPERLVDILRFNINGNDTKMEL